MLDPAFFRVKHGCVAGASDAKNSRAEPGDKLCTWRGHLTIPQSDYYFNRKIETENERFPAEPWTKPGLAVQNCSSLFFEQFWLRSPSRSEPFPYTSGTVALM